MLKEEKSNERIESRLEITSYLQNLKYSLKNGAKIHFQEKRNVDKLRDFKYSNEYAMMDLFPNKDPITVLKHELLSLTVHNYIRTVRDINRPNNSEMREFGKIYGPNKDIYIKIRVELLKSGSCGIDNYVFIMSFHYSTIPFSESTFPYFKS